MSKRLCNTLYGGIYGKDDMIIKVSNLQQVTMKKTYDDPFHEVRILQDLSHANIIELQGFHFDEDKQRLLIYLPRSKYGDLFDYMQQRAMKPLPEEQVRIIIQQVANALQYLHEDKNLAHMDVSLENILVMDKVKPTVVLCDFGSACHENKEVVAKNGVRPGKLNYSAPELFGQAPIFHPVAVDVFALGVCIFHLLTGCQPFVQANGDRYDLIAKQGVEMSFRSFNKFSKAAAEIIDACFQKDPTQRPSIKELLKLSFFKAPPPPPPT